MTARVPVSKLMCHTDSPCTLITDLLGVTIVALYFMGSFDKALNAKRVTSMYIKGAKILCLTIVESMPGNWRISSTIWV